MTFTLTKPYPRLWTLEAGVAMVVTDLHGDWEAYRRYRDRFVDLQANGRADCLIFTGDLIHMENPDEPDKSLEIVLDVMALQASYGSAIIYLCGNHEMPHIYGISLAKGERIYTPAFEAILSQSQQRAEVIALFDSLPFYLRTRAGVMLAHAGASVPFAKPENALTLFNWSHQDLLAWADEVLASEDVESLRTGYARFQQAPSYEAMAQYYLAVSGPDDPRYNDLLRGFIATSHPTFDNLLWPALFTRCEKEYGLADYSIFLNAMLQEVAVDFSPQRVLVAGHITMRGGSRFITERHLRLASAHHATPREAGQYLLFDTAQPVERVEDLLPGLGSVYRFTP
jgi:hypothetical protein